MVPMMQWTDEDAVYLYAENRDLQMLSMPYEHTTGKELSMVVFLPRAHNLTTIEDSMNPDTISALQQSATSKARNGLFPEVYHEDKIFPP